MSTRLPAANRSHFAIFVFIAMGLLAPGCTAKPAPNVPVKGKVVYEGKGVSDVQITFWPHDPTSRRVDALSDRNGDFSLECPAGNYTVTLVSTVSTSAPIPDAGMPGQVGITQPARTDKSHSGVPARYQARDKTPLHVDIGADGKQDLVLEIKK